MAEDSDKDKTEDATSHKLKQARDRGQVAKGMDLGFLAALTGLVGFGWARGCGSACKRNPASGVIGVQKGTTIPMV